MKLIVGLGNPGGQYKDTRHNIGFMVVEKLARELGETDTRWEFEKKHKADTMKIGEVVLLKPQTTMNVSGISVKSLKDYFHLDSSDIWVIHDDLDLPLGKIRIRMGGGTGGHNGVDSIIRHIGTDAFLRIRLGIGRGREDVKKGTDQHFRHHAVIDFVLSRFKQSEAGSLRKLIKYGVEAVRIALTDGIDKAMNRFN